MSFQSPLISGAVEIEGGKKIKEIPKPKFKSIFKFQENLGRFTYLVCLMNQYPSP